jgi:hypothetical protein
LLCLVFFSGDFLQSTSAGFFVLFWLQYFSFTEKTGWASSCEKIKLWFQTLSNTNYDGVTSIFPTCHWK